MAMAAAAKRGLTLTSSARIGGSIAAGAAAKIGPQKLLPNSAMQSPAVLMVAKGLASRVELGGAGAAVRAAVMTRTTLRRLHSNSNKDFDLETAMFEHKIDVKKLLHEQNMKIVKLQGEINITRAENNTLKEELKLEIIKSQTTIIYGAMGLAGVGLLFHLPDLI